MGHSIYGFVASCKEPFSQAIRCEGTSTFTQHSRLYSSDPQLDLETCYHAIIKASA